MAQMQLARMKVGRTMNAAMNAISPPDNEMDMNVSAPLAGGRQRRVPATGRRGTGRESYVQTRSGGNDSRKYAKWANRARRGGPA